MTHVSPHEHGVVRVLAVNLPKAEAIRFAETRLAEALGAALDPAYVDVIPVSDLAEVGLRGFLIDGHGVDQEALSKDQAKLDALSGVVVVLTSKAFKARPAELAESPEVSLIGAYPLAEAAPAISAFRASVDPTGSDPVPEKSEGQSGTPVRRSWLIVAAALGLAVVAVLAVAR